MRGTPRGSVWLALSIVPAVVAVMSALVSLPESGEIPGSPQAVAISLALLGVTALFLGLGLRSLVAGVRSGVDALDYFVPLLVAVIATTWGAGAVLLLAGDQSL